MRQLKNLYRLVDAFVEDTRACLQQVAIAVPSICRAHRFSRVYRDTASQEAPVSLSSSINPLWNYFQGHEEGRGIWKWEHYFDIYHHHFARFVGQTVNVVEIGIHSGGSLDMWRSYFGGQSHIYGIDIEEACKAYETDNISVFIGDQADRAFWRTFRSTVQGIDIVIDDGGHTPEQQEITLEEVLPHLRPGGVYLCEDVHGISNRFAAYVSGLATRLNGMNLISGPSLQSAVSPLQSSIHSIHFYPYVVAIEKHRVSPTRLSAPRHGTEWQVLPCG